MGKRKVCARPASATRNQATVPKAVVETASTVTYTTMVVVVRRVPATAAGDVPRSARMHHNKTSTAMKRCLVQSNRARITQVNQSARLQSHTSSTLCADGAFVDELHTGGFERSDELHQRIHIAANHALACLHPLNGGERQPTGFCQRALVHSDERSSSPELCGADHVLSINIDLLSITN